MFRTKAIAAGALAGLLVLSACGRSSDTAAASESTAPAATISAGPATGSLTMWAQGAEGENLPALLKEFEAANPGVTVDVTAIPWDAAHNKYQTAIAGGQTPDIAQMGTTWMGDFADAFDAAPAEFADAGFFAGSVNSTEVNGTTVGVPWYVDTRVVFYRKDLAEQAGYSTFPTNYEDFKAMAKAMQDEGRRQVGHSTAGGRRWLLPERPAVRLVRWCRADGLDRRCMEPGLRRVGQGHELLPELLHRRDRQSGTRHRSRSCGGSVRRRFGADDDLRPL